MNAFQSSTGVVVQINFKLLLAFGFAMAAWWIWPDSMRGYGWGFISICLGSAALGLLVEAIRMAVKLRRRGIVEDELRKRGRTPKTAKLVSDDDLRKAGML